MCVRTCAWTPKSLDNAEAEGAWTCHRAHVTRHPSQVCRSHITRHTSHMRRSCAKGDRSKGYRGYFLKKGYRGLHFGHCHGPFVKVARGQRSAATGSRMGHRVTATSDRLQQHLRSHVHPGQRLTAPRPAPGQVGRVENCFLQVGSRPWQARAENPRA